MLQLCRFVVAYRYEQGRGGNDRRVGRMVFEGRAYSEIVGDAGYCVVMDPVVLLYSFSQVDSA